MPLIDSTAERESLRERLRERPQIELDLGGAPLELRTAWGLFSAKGIDEGTALLLNELALLPPQRRVLDLGCGYGALGLALATLWPGADVVLVDKDVLAVETTAGNIESNGLSNARAILSPGFRDAPPGPYDLIVANLPAQAGNEALDEVLLDAHDHLAPGGSLVVVTVLGLRRYMRRRMQALFGDYSKAHQGPRHVIAEATRWSDENG
jgi:16S rRNA (guanine1207-N2)-methyltransferase